MQYAVAATVAFPLFELSLYTCKIYTSLDICKTLELSLKALTLEIPYLHGYERLLIEMSQFCFFSHLFFFLVILFLA